MTNSPDEPTLSDLADDMTELRAAQTLAPGELPSPRGSDAPEIVFPDDPPLPQIERRDTEPNEDEDIRSIVKNAVAAGVEAGLKAGLGVIDGKLQQLYDDVLAAVGTLSNRVTTLEQEAARKWEIEALKEQFKALESEMKKAKEKLHRLAQ